MSNYRFALTLSYISIDLIRTQSIANTTMMKLEIAHLILPSPMGIVKQKQE